MFFVMFALKLLENALDTPGFFDCKPFYVPLSGFGRMVMHRRKDMSMDKVRFGRTELMVSRVALGGIPIMRLDPKDATAVVHEALALGINFIDTARAYTDSEEKIGAAIRGIPRDELVLSTKSLGQTAEELCAHLDTSLTNLGVDYVDIFHLHSISSRERYDNIFMENGPVHWLQQQIAAGKVRFAAFSSHTIDLAVEIMQTNLFDVVQLPLNFVDR